MIKLVVIVLSFSSAVCIDFAPGLRDADFGLTTPQFIVSRGFVSQVHQVWTKDGYRLFLHRIINPYLKGNQQRRRPVILMHGLLVSSLCWVENSPGGHIRDPVRPGIVGNNLAFELAKRGFDVWMGNQRGVTYSTDHFIENPQTWKFWDFSLDEFGLYDTPAMIDYVRNVTGSQKVSYVSHSQGGTSMLITMSTNKKYQEIVQPFIAMAPNMNYSHLTSPFVLLAGQKWLTKAAEVKGGELLPDSLIRAQAKIICSLNGGNELCKDLILFVSDGWGSTQLNSTRMGVYLGSESYQASTKNIVQITQFVNSGRFAMYDYGPLENVRRYGTRMSPEYQVADIDPRHIAIFSAVNDGLADAQDIDILRSRLQSRGRRLLEDYVVPDEDFGHFDFVWGLEAGRYVNSKVVNILDRYK